MARPITEKEEKPTQTRRHGDSVETIFAPIRFLFVRSLRRNWLRKDSKSESDTHCAYNFFTSKRSQETRACVRAPSAKIFKVVRGRKTTSMTSFVKKHKNWVRKQLLLVDTFSALPLFAPQLSCDVFSSFYDACKSAHVFSICPFLSRHRVRLSA